MSKNKHLLTLCVHKCPLQRDEMATLCCYPQKLRGEIMQLNKKKKKCVTTSCDKTRSLSTPTLRVGGGASEQQDALVGWEWGEEIPKPQGAFLEWEWGRRPWSPRIHLWILPACDTGSSCFYFNVLNTLYKNWNSLQKKKHTHTQRLRKMQGKKEVRGKEKREGKEGKKKRNKM